MRTQDQSLQLVFCHHCAVPEEIHTPPHPQRDWNSLGVGRGVCIGISIGQLGEGGLRQTPFLGGGMNIFWNYTLYRIK